MLSSTVCLLVAGILFAADLPEGWYLIGGDGAKNFMVTVENDGGFSGSGLRVEKTNENGSGFSGVGQSVSAENYLGKTIRLSGYLRTDSVRDGYAGLWLRVDKPNGMQLLDNMGNRGVRGTTDWQPYESVLRVEAESTRIVFGALLTGSGTMFADEFSLEVVSDSTPTTEIQAYGTKEPLNLGF